MANARGALIEQVEQLATSRGIDMHTADLDTLDGMWNEVKSAATSDDRSVVE